MRTNISSQGRWKFVLKNVSRTPTLAGLKRSFLKAVLTWLIRVSPAKCMALIAVMSVIYHCIILLHHRAEVKQCSRFTLKECALVCRFCHVSKTTTGSKYVSGNVTLLENAFCFIINIKWAQLSVCRSTLGPCSISWWMRQLPHDLRLAGLCISSESLPHRRWFASQPGPFSTTFKHRNTKISMHMHSILGDSGVCIVMEVNHT